MVIRLLGARQLFQAAASQLQPTPSILVTGVVVDGVHAASMIALAIRDRQWRRAALGEALVACVLAVIGVSAARAAQ